MKMETFWTKLCREAMACAMAHPVATNRPYREGKLQDSLFRNQLSRSRAVLRHSRPLAEKVLDGSISLRKAYDQVQAAKPKRQTPSLPTFKPAVALTGEIDPAELDQFVQIFRAEK
jgi:hypothetical protein